MKAIFRNTISFLIAGIVVMLLGSCSLMGPSQNSGVDQSLFLTAQMGVTLSAMLTRTAAPCEGCPGSNASASMTAAMATNFASTPSNTPPAWATVLPVAGDLGWGTVYGVIIDGVTNLPIAGATVRCDHFSYTSAYRCSGVTTTDQKGAYLFKDVFFHDTDRISLTVEAPGYAPLVFTQNVQLQPEMHLDLGLFPSPGGSLTPTFTPYIMCTAPVCEGGQLVCGSANGCPGGCGTVCQMPALPQVSCTPPACAGGQLVCGNANGCPGGCGTVCQMPTP